MKALSLWQPWASAMAYGWKRIETRHWSTSYRGPLAIHAAKRWTWEERDEWECARRDNPELRLPDRPPLGAVVAVCRLVDIRPTELLRGRINGQECRWGDYSDRRFGWIFEDIRALPEPIPFRGAQGFFDIPYDLLSGEWRPDLPEFQQGGLALEGDG